MQYKTPSALSDEQIRQIQAFIAQAKEIRIFLPDVSNFGHHGTTINIMYRLIELGTKQIRIIYAAGGDTPDPSGTENLETVVETWPKLQLLIAKLPKNPTNNFRIGNTPVILQTLEQWAQEKAEEVPLVLTGGWDEATLDNARDLAGARLILKAKHLLILQPFAWFRSLNLACVPGKEKDVLIDLADEHALGESYKNAVYYVSRLQPTPEEEAWFKQIDVAKYSCVQTILTLCTAPIPSMEMCPVYFSPGRTRAPGEVILFNLITGIITRNRKLELKEKKPTMIVVMAPRTDKADYLTPLQEMLKDTKQFGNKAQSSPLRDQYLTKQGFAEAFSKVRFLGPADFTAATCGKILQDLGKEGVIVLTLQRVPNIIYNWLYSSATLPSLFEGNGTASMVLNLGLPYLHLHCDEDEHTDFYPLPVAESILKQGEFSQLCNTYSTLLEAGPEAWEQQLKQRRTPPDQALAEFMQDATEPSRPLYKAFRAQKAVYHLQANDKLLRALAYIFSLG